jgi:hypothetical protein
MSKPVRIILGLAAVAIALIWLYPSWIYVSHDPLFGFTGKIGSSWLFVPPMHYGAQPDYVKNLSYTALVLVAACALLLWSRWARATRA